MHLVSIPFSCRVLLLLIHKVSLPGYTNILLLKLHFQCRTFVTLQYGFSTGTATSIIILIAQCNGCEIDLYRE